MQPAMQLYGKASQAKPQAQGFGGGSAVLNKNLGFALVFGEVKDASVFIKKVEELVSSIQPLIQEDKKKSSKESRRVIIEALLRKLSKLEPTSLELVLPLMDTVLVFHLGPCRTYLLQRDVLWPLVGQSGEGALAGFSVLEVPLGLGDRFLLLHCQKPKSEIQKSSGISEIKLKAILSVDKVEKIPDLIESESLQQGGVCPAVAVFEMVSGDRAASKYSHWSLYERFEILKNSRFFAQLSMEESIRVISTGETQQFPMGAPIIREGGADQDIFFILDGKVEVKIKGKHRRYIQKGEIFGEMAAFTHEPRSSEVIANQLTYLLVLKYEYFQPLLKKDPALAVKIYEAVIETLVKRQKQSETR